MASICKTKIVTLYKLYSINNLIDQERNKKRGRKMIKFKCELNETVARDMVKCVRGKKMLKVKRIRLMSYLSYLSV